MNGNNWWQLAFCVACLVALGCLALGLWIGYGIGQDKAAERETAARFAVVPEPGRHRVAVPRQLPAAPKAVSTSTADLFARLEAETAPLACIVQPARVHRPGWATGEIARMSADTDRFIAQMGGQW